MRPTGLASGVYKDNLDYSINRDCKRFSDPDCSGDRHTDGPHDFPEGEHRSRLQDKGAWMKLRYGNSSSFAHSLRALSRGLFLCAKHLFVAAILAGPPASRPISQRTGHQWPVRLGMEAREIMEYWFTRLSTRAI